MDRQGASVAIQISGMFGSQQEKAQRLGRILRPKPGANQAHFYTIVSHDTREQDFALKRQLFLCEQGYEYHIEFEGEFEGESDGESKEAAHSSQSGYCLGGRPSTPMKAIKVSMSRRIEPGPSIEMRWPVRRWGHRSAMLANCFMWRGDYFIAACIAITPRIGRLQHG